MIKKCGFASVKVFSDLQLIKMQKQIQTCYFLSVTAVNADTILMK